MAPKLRHRAGEIIRQRALVPGETFDLLDKLLGALCESGVLGGEALYLRAGVAQLPQTDAAGAGRLELGVARGFSACDVGL